MAKDLIFDIDGTLWDSTDGIAGAFNEILLEEPLVQPYYPLTAEDLKREFGKPLYDIGYSLFPAVPKEENNRIIDRMCDHEVAWLRSHIQPAYPGVIETLKALSETCRLFIVSNCQAGYAECFIETHGLEPLIMDHLCPGDTGLLKADNIRLLIERYALTTPVYIGDTAGDEAACREAGVPFIHAAYGFGEAEAPAGVLTRFNELPHLIETL
ncbi:MAG: HAD hydrolase-like protein [Lachnospiraceae bacterium]|nr:HAD hydrolase-like protein [Lachnospiraceae bacterium]